MANVSHDLKTPLTMIKAYAEMSTDLHANNKDKQKEDINIIISEVDRLTNLVNDISTLSKIQANIDTLNIEEFDLIELTKDIIKKYSILEETENYNFIFNHNKDKLLISADKQKLEQVLYNLINNAINYTGEDNKIEINITKQKKAPFGAFFITNYLSFAVFIPLRVKEILCFLTSTSLMRTSITSPVLNISEGCLMNLSLISEMWSRPSW